MQPILLTPTVARRLAITKQRLAGPAPSPTASGIVSLIRELGCVQIDPIRVVERTQYIVLFSRLGAYDPALLHRLLFEDKALFEYWAHAASICLTENYPIHQSQMRLRARRTGVWDVRIREWMAANATFRREVLETLAANGPTRQDKLGNGTQERWPSDGWNAGRDVDRMVSFMWRQGELVVAGRGAVYRTWALAREWLPASAWVEELDDAEAERRAAQISLCALGTATAKQIGLHFIRGSYPGLAGTLKQLVADGHIVPAKVDGEGESWPGEWYVHTEDLPLVERLQSGAWEPRTVLLSPFDNLICDRDRTELMWGFRYRIEIYTPAAKRQYGYYVLPVLHGDRLIGRVDLRMDRKAGVLKALSVHAEPDAVAGGASLGSREVGAAVERAVTELAAFLGGSEVDWNGASPTAGFAPGSAPEGS